MQDLKDEDVIIIDELGPLELEEGYGYQQALHLLDEGRYRKAVVVVRPSLLPLARVRWPAAQGVSVTGEVTMIRVRKVSVSYGATPVLQDIDLEIRQGEFVLITGPSGCGKSTLAYALSGLIPHSIPAESGGQVEIDGLEHTKS